MGVAILFCLCGLNTMYIGRCYENATKANRRNTFPNPDAPIDALAWSSDNNSLYLCQCSLTGIKDKIDEVALIANELDKVTLKDFTTRPKIYSLIITNIERTLILDEHIKEATRKRSRQTIILAQFCQIRQYYYRGTDS